jgi:PAS domain S-box-containing protein
MHACFRAIVEASPDGAWVTDAGGITVFANARVAQMLGYQREEMVGRPASDFVYQPAIGGEALLRRSDGTRLAATMATVTLDPGEAPSPSAFHSGGPTPGGPVTGGPVTIAFVVDSTEQRQAERQFRAVFEHALDAMLILDDEQRFLDANPAALALLGTTRSQLLGLRAADVLEGMWSEVWRRLQLEGRATGEAGLACAGQTPGAERPTVEYHATAAILPGRHLMVLHDLTERQRLEQHRARLATIVETSADAIIGVDAAGVVTYWSPAATRMFGWEAEEILGRTVCTLAAPDQVPECRRNVVNMQDGVPLRAQETVRRHKDGTLIEVSLTVSPIFENGRVVGASAVYRDLTEQRKLKASLAIADRMVSVGTLAAGVAHEINNPLAVVVGNLDYMARLLSVESEGAASQLSEPLNEARDAADRVRAIVRDLKLFSRPDEAKRGPVDVRRVLESSVRMAWNEIRHRARLVKLFAEVPHVEASEGRLGQVFLNLLVNAAQAIPEGSAESNQIGLATRVAEDGRVVVEVSDTGTGIPAENLPRLFEPFFTTKPIGIGTGLGLSICQRLVHQLGGEIQVVSTPGQGTRFRVLLPPSTLTTAEPAAAPTPTAPRAAPGPRARILVVDDEPMILKSVRRTLEPHEVVEFTSARKALAALRAGERFDVIVCDLMMPEMTGMELYQALLELAPDQAQRMIFVTGGAFTARARAFLDEVENPRVDKPLDAANLRALISERVRGDRAGATSPPGPPGL